MIAWLSAAGAVAALLATAWAAGAVALRSLGPLGAGERLGQAGADALAVACGLGLLAEAGLGLALIGGLRPWIVLPLMAAVHGLAWRSWAGLARRLGSTAWRETLRRRWPTGLAVVLAAAALVVLALYPPLASDATVYHLPYAESLLGGAAGGAGGPPGLVPEARFPIFPQAMETLYALALLLGGGELAPQLVHAASALVTAALLFAWGGRAGSPTAGAIAAGLWLGSPHLVWLASQAYVDVGLAMFVTVGWLAWEVGADGGPEPPAAEAAERAAGGQWRWLAVSAAAFGLAAGCKYLGLFFVGFFALRTLLHALLRSRRAGAGLAAAAGFAIVALVALVPWYLRVTVHTGSPLFPFYPALFGESEWTPVGAGEVGAESAAGASAHTGAVTGAGTGAQAPARGALAEIGDGLAALARLPWDAVFQRQRYSSQPPWSPFWIVSLPLVLVLWVRGPPAGFVARLATVGVYGLFWLTLEPRDLRFLVPVLPALAVCVGTACVGRVGAGPGGVGLGGVGLVWGAAAGPLRRAALVGRRLLPLVLILPAVLYAAYEVRRHGPPPSSAAARVAYLERWVPGFAAIHRLNVAGGASGGRWAVYALYGAPLRHYAQGRVLGDWAGPDRYALVLADVDSPPRLAAALRRSGAEWLLVRRGDGVPPVRLPPTAEFRRHFETVATAPDYLLYRLRDETRPAAAR